MHRAAKQTASPSHNESAIMFECTWQAYMAAGATAGADDYTGTFVEYDGTEYACTEVDMPVHVRSLRLGELEMQPSAPRVIMSSYCEHG